jgi:hypothetical protein
MKKSHILFSFIILLSSSILLAQQTPAKEQTKDFAIVGSTAHIGDGTVIENSIIVISNGKITAIGPLDSTPVTKQAMDIIDATGKHVYPGFIVPNSTLGLVEIDNVKASNDESEIGLINPHIRSLIAYNAESKVVESMRPNGVLLAQIAPTGGLFPGTSSVVQLDAWNWEDAAVKVDDGIHMRWPNSFSRGRWWLGEEPGLKPNKDYVSQVNKIVDYINESKAYNAIKQSTINLPFQAMNGIFDGSKKLYINVNDEKGIIDAINFSKDNDIKHMVIVGGYQAGNLASFLNQNNISVFLRCTHTLPENEDDDYDYNYKAAKKLVDAGVVVSLETNGRMDSRNLPFYAGTTVAHGLTKEQALQLITLNTAKILGIDSDYGSLTKGKSATLFISEGDALDMKTNILTHAFIDGRELSLETHQTKLWKRYSGKFKSQ